jgi:hypothetical protein
MERYAQTKNVAIGLECTTMTAKRGPLSAQDADAIITSDKIISGKKGLQKAKN